MKSKCRYCGAKPAVDRRNRPLIFCSKQCNVEWRRKSMLGNKFRNNLKPANAFQSGHRPWNRGMTGIHLSPHSEFKPGQIHPTKEEVGTVNIRKHRGVSRAWIKVADPNVWRPRAVAVWELFHGPVPHGSIVHHKDRDTLNDSPENLEVQTRAEHLKEHRSEHDEVKKSVTMKRAWVKRRASNSKPKGANDDNYHRSPHIAQ